MTAFRFGGKPRYAHQRRGLAKMLETHGVTAVLFDPGLGKTATVLDYASILALKLPSREARVLVVCPLVAVDTWVIQARDWLSPDVGFWAEALGGSLLQRAEALAARGGNPHRKPLQGRNAAKVRRALAHPRALHYEHAMAWDARQPEQHADRPFSQTQGPDGIVGPRVVLEVTNLDTYTSRRTVGSATMADVLLDAVRRFGPDLVVVDESHKIKATAGNASKLMARIGRAVDRRIILTGTVMPHSPLDVFAQWRFLDPYAFGEELPDGTKRQATFGQFKDRYAKLGGWMGKEVVGFVNLDHMQQVMARNAVVARKADALDLPKTTDAVLPVILSPAEQAAYAAMRDALAVQMADGTMASVTNRLVQMLRLRQITGGHLPSDAGGPTRVIGTSKAATITSLVNDTLAGEKRIVIFALFSLEIRMLAQMLATKGTVVQVIEGSTPVPERLEMRQRFGSDDPTRIVMVAQIKTMSLAVNELVTANHAVFASLSQQRDDLIQAQDRLNRIGQTRPVTFWYALAPGTVDEVILQSHQQRTDLESAMLRHIQQGARPAVR